ncbi:MAG: hypothetical protein WA060_00635 [Minisyncoccia bacterium]
MDRKKLFKISAYAIILLSLVNFVALKLHWYFLIWYFDIIMHFWGGLCVGFLLLWILYKDNLDFSFGFVLKIGLGVLFIGSAWEVFEIIFNNIIAGNQFDILDTTSDIFFDLSGGLCAILYLWKKLQK